MKRRELLTRSRLIGAAPSLAPMAAHAAEPENRQAQFAASREPWTPAFTTLADDFPLTQARVRGRWAAWSVWGLRWGLPRSAWSAAAPQSRSGAPSGKNERYGRASSTARANEGRASKRAR